MDKFWFVISMVGVVLMGGSAMRYFYLGAFLQIVGGILILLGVWSIRPFLILRYGKQFYEVDEKHETSIRRLLPKVFRLALIGVLLFIVGGIVKVV
ncbi:hypothetical protein Amet_1790 [Alkaliphilus metalliredigens QYMF]|uniref:Uncharacterized protein n=1 Tax=Alkaliphilus metalliredigens (strain QYMF) TaxID=293826 RepID=A6TP43_ALKMQ|nr:hypothetical protein [Alkaliphilus metalliredigens]ABR47961.1 hypothetical protein Amet_1790 [Alkaliphilus metalliredigens QYMF]